MRRAVHQILDNPRVFEDPVALAILGVEAEAELRADAARPQPLGAQILRAFMAVRSRFAEDELAHAIHRGATQYVVLGAGLDTFAYRNPWHDRGLRVFEVDHPATQTWKRHRLDAARIAIPSSLTFAPVNFESQSLADGLQLAGFQPDAVTFFSWLGVVPYLTHISVQTTLRFIAAMPPGSGVVFDYARPRESLNEAERLAFDNLARRVAAAGEPFQTFFDPPALTEELRRMGFRQIEDLGSTVINARYFQNRTDGLALMGDAAHLLCAQV